MTSRNHAAAIGAALLLTVASQIFYITIVSGSDNEMLRPLTWFTELFAFTAVTVLSFAQAVRRPDRAVLWSMIGFSGLLNVLQVSIGLSMFAPAMEAGESVPQLFAAILAGAFFLYFLAKLVLGIAAIEVGTNLYRRGSAVGKVTGLLALVAGMAAIGLNFLAMVDAKPWTFAAGGAGTAATALLALALFVQAKDTAAASEA